MNFKRHDQLGFIADSANAFARREISKRDFMKKMGMAGVGFSAFAASMLGNQRPFFGNNGLISSARAEETTPAYENMKKWFQSFGDKYKGTKIRYTSEATPPTIIVNQFVKDEFTAWTGIEVEVEIVPLEQVLAKATTDVQGQLGTYDLYYLDQSWMATFAPDMINPKEYYDANAALAMPDFDWDDFSKPLVDGICMYDGKLVTIPFDIPIAILMYRKDILDKHGLKVPTTMAEYMDNAKKITEAEKANGIFGNTAQARSGHYSLECDWTIWLWGNGGSIFNKDKKFSGGDERGIAGLEYFQELIKNSPPAATTWTWDGQGQSLTQGQAAQCISWGEYFPGLDGPDSKVKGLFEAARCPKEDPGRRPASEAGFGEIPAIGHQGGSGLGLSSYSKNKEAAFLFMQYACSKETVLKTATAGGGSGPVRTSSFTDPRTKAKAVVGPGTTRHFDVLLATIQNDMGSEPDMPIWAELANNQIPVELGKLLTGQAYNGSAKECMAALSTIVDGRVKEAGLL